MRSFKAFTLIELLIVVAIIAILAAIAVPNFIEAQVRAKVSRTYSDVRSLKTAIESYVIDHNIYCETDRGVSTFGPGGVLNSGAGLLRCTTPISYITSLPLSPWEEQNLGHAAWPGPAQRHANTLGTYLWVRARVEDPLPSGVTATSGIDQSYMTDRLTYLRGTGSLTPANVNFARSGEWMVKSVGPNNYDDRSAMQNPQTGLSGSGDQARVYDPTNGTTSAGDIVTFRDTSIQPSGG